MEKQTERTYIIEEEGLYKLKINGEILRTPKPFEDELATSYKELAEALRKEYKKYGCDGFKKAESLMSFHYITVSYFSFLEKEEAVKQLLSKDWEKDWSLNIGGICFDRELAGRWGVLFGNPDDRKESIKEWLGKCTRMQLSAIYSLFHVMHSYNLIYLMAFISERVPQDTQKRAINDMCELASMFVPFPSSRVMMEFFKTFSFYYGIHTKEYGEHIDSLN